MLRTVSYWSHSVNWFRIKWNSYHSVFLCWLNRFDWEDRRQLRLCPWCGLCELSWSVWFSCVADLVSGRGVHIGATQVPSSISDFTWLNGEPVNITATKSFWAEGHPKYSRTNGVIILLYIANPRYAWVERFGGRNMHFICERPLLLY